MAAVMGPASKSSQVSFFLIGQIKEPDVMLLLQRSWLLSLCGASLWWLWKEWTTTSQFTDRISSCICLFSLHHIKSWKLTTAIMDNIYKQLHLNTHNTYSLLSYSLKLCAIFWLSIMCCALLGSATPNVPGSCTANCSFKRDVSISILLVLSCFQNDFSICREMS